MRVMLLSPYGLKLSEIMIAAGDEVIVPPAINNWGNCDMAVMYGHRDILTKDEIARYPRGVLNIHTSLLPYGRGAHPNFWAWFNGEPHGVSIHWANSGIDTGPVVFSSLVHFPNVKEETLHSSYLAKHLAAERAFSIMWKYIREGNLPGTVQDLSSGSFHRAKDIEPFMPLLKNKWLTPVEEVIAMGQMYRRGEIPNG